VWRAGFGFLRLLGHAAPGAGELNEEIAVTVRSCPLGEPNALRRPFAEFLQQHIALRRCEFSKEIPVWKKGSIG
jgi:hypothetical protein